MFCRPIKIQSFYAQTSKYTRPLGNVLAPVTQMFVADFSAVWQDMAFTLTKLGRNFKQGVPLSSDLRNRVIELAQLHSNREAGRRLRVDAKTISKIVKQFRESGSEAPKPLNHTMAASKCSFQDSMLLQTMAQTKGSSSLRELRDDLTIHGDCGVLATSTISRRVRTKLPRGQNYSRKRLGKCASERFTNDNLVYTQNSFSEYPSTEAFR